MTPRLWWLLFAFGWACAGKMPPPTTEAPLSQQQADVERLARQADSLLRRQDELVWKAWTQGAPVDIGETYLGQEELYAAASIHKVQSLRATTAEPRQQRALTHLQNYLAGEFLAAKLAEVSDTLANLEASVTFNVEGAEYPYRDLDRLLANERSAPRRRAFYTSAASAIERLVPSLRRKEEVLDHALKELDYPSYEAFGRELRETDLDALAALASRILDSTQVAYQTVMGRLSQSEMEIPFAKLHRADIPRLFRPQSVDDLFAKEQLLPRVETTLAGMGLSLSKLKNVKVDVTDTPRKNPRGITLAVVVPTDIRVSLRPVPGIEAQTSYLHEAGHALQSGLTQETRFELAKLGNPTVAETVALLFEQLSEDPAWLEANVQLIGERRKAFLTACAARRLFLMRRAAGRILYQVELHRSPPADPAALYNKVMARTYQLPMGPEATVRRFMEEEDFYASADTFRAAFLAAQLQAQLQTRFGALWWKRAEAGQFLRQLIAPGNAFSADELAARWGDSGLKPEVLLERLSTALETPVDAKTNGS